MGVDVAAHAGLLVALAAFGFAAIRARDAWTGVALPAGSAALLKITAIAPHRLPRLADKIYIGHGFLWGQKHTQRRIDAQRPEARPFITQGALWPALRTSVKALTHTPLAPIARLLTSPRYWWNPIGDQPDLGGSPLLHGVEPNEEAIGLGQKHRVGHLLVLGTTRSARPG